MLNKIKNKINEIRSIENKNEKFRNLLNRNKIYFETAGTTALTVMSLVVSCTANSIANKSNQISKLEIEMQQKDKLPNFTISIEEDEDEDGNKEEYVNILNTGGMISDAYINCYCYIEFIPTSDTNKETSKIIQIHGAFDDFEAGYDYDNNRFSLKSNLSSFYDMYYEIRGEMDSQSMLFYHKIYELFEITYINYFGDNCEKYYRLDRDDITPFLEIKSETYYDFIQTDYDYIFCDYDEPLYEELRNEEKDKLKNIILDVISE